MKRYVAKSDYIETDAALFSADEQQTAEIILRAVSGLEVCVAKKILEKCSCALQQTPYQFED